MLLVGSARAVLMLLLIFGGSVAATAAELTYDIRIENGTIPETMRLMHVRQGDVVQLRWTSDRPIVIHLHGYDIEKHITADGVVEMSFTANATGRFPIEIHGQGGAHEGAPLATIEVYPR